MKTVLVIGGTGTLGQVLVPKLLEQFDRVRVMSRGEHAQMEMDERLSNPNIDYFIGDVRDRDRVWYAANGVDAVFNLAAIKSVDKAEYNPNEAIATNILGAQNVVDACIKRSISKAIFTSTDKAVEPLNIYGASKLCAEKLFIDSNAYSGKNGPRFSAVRYGNVLGSQGSVIQKWKKGNHKITASSMTRFWITKDKAANFVLQSFNLMERGEIFIPKMKSSTMGELATAYDKNTSFEVIGLRPGEKLHEALWGYQETPQITDIQCAYVSWPVNPKFPIRKYGSPVLEHLTSENAPRFTETELQEMLCTL